MKIQKTAIKLLASLCLGGIGAMSILPAYAGMEDDPLITKFMLDKFEVGSLKGTNPIAWESSIWVGKDINKLYFKTSGERVSGKNEGTESQLLFSRAVTAFWDIQGGVRHDTAPGANRNYATIGVQGVAPYYFETDASLSFGKNDQVKLNANFEYEMMLTQKWVLSPGIELNIYAKDDEPMGVGSGLSDMKAGLRLRYEVTREFAPYIGINWAQKFGGSADFAEAEGESTNETMLVVGIRAWY